MPKEAKVTQINSIERSHEYSYFKKLPGGAFIDRVRMTNYLEVGEPICYLYGVDNDNNYFMTDMRPNNSRLGFIIFGYYPKFDQYGYQALRDETRMFFRIYGYE